MKDETGNVKHGISALAGKRPAKLSRRAVLRAGTAAMPVVLTLQSGDALARTSNFIGEALGARDDHGDVLCLDTTGKDVYYGKVDIGLDGANVNVLPDTEFYPGHLSGKSGTPVTADMACRDGGFLKTHDDGWHYANLPRGGVVVSNVALNSVSSRAPIFLRRWSDLG